MILFITIDDLKRLSEIVSDVFRDVEGTYIDLMADTFTDIVDPERSLLEFFSYLIIAPEEEVEKALTKFFEIPLEEMSSFIRPIPYSQLKQAKSLCPPASEGPYPWQVILARWRVMIQK